jgi:multidrug efflux system membrane fusion protein
VVDERSRVHLKPVQVGITTGTSADILGGISEGERVVVDGTDRLIEGAQVRVRKAGEADNPAGFDPEAGSAPRGRGEFKGSGRGGDRSGRGEFKKGDAAGSGTAPGGRDEFKKARRGGETR